MVYIRTAIQHLQGYCYGEQPEQTDIIKLNTNENPYQPSPKVTQALQNFDVARLRLYPNPSCLQFRQLAARLHRVKPEQIIVTNGGDELLRLAVTTFVPSHGAVGTTEPSYSLYPVLAAIQEATFITLPFNTEDDFADSMAARMNQAGVQLTCLVNPHAPSGRLVQVSMLGRLAEKLNGVLLIDEAYCDFIAPKLHHNSLDLLLKHDNVLILRSLSKGYSLAGLRFGYGIGNCNLIRPMTEKTKDSYNLDTISQNLACAAIQDQSHMQKNADLVRTERRRVTQELRTRGWHVGDSEANFVLATSPARTAEQASSVFGVLRQEGILVRYFSEPALASSLRITIGTKTENNALLAALDQAT